uniref:Mic1 domain-containing protein n=1 Tax=Globodera rostochiensis TaxID=31243 RepID=A0A914I2M8_GLORO
MLNIGANIVNLRTNGTKNIGIFYDSVTERVCTIRTEGEQLTITAKSADRAYHEILFDIREKFGRVRAVGFSSDLQIASIQQEDSVVEFAVLQDGKVVANFQHNCNFKGAVILGVHWLSNRQIAFVTEAGCEFYLVNAYKRVLKSIQRLATVINWFSFHAPSNLFICSSGVKNDTMTCLTFQQNAPHTLGSFEVDFGFSSAKPRLLERDIGVSSIYGKLCILVLKFEAVHGFATGLNVYELVPSEPQTPQLKCFLRLDLVGLVGLHVVDNLILIHHKNAKSTLVFDIQLSTERPICSTQLHMFSAVAYGANDAFPLKNDNDDGILNEIHWLRLLPDTFLYNSAWKMSLPDVVLEYAEHTLLADSAHDLNFLVRFLINRRNGESVLLKLLQRAILHKSLKFARITQIFRQILQGALQEDDVHKESGVESLAASTPKWFPPVAPFAPITVSHNSLLRSVFEPLHERQDEVDKQSLASLMMEFFLILKRTNVKVQETYVSELLVKMLVAADMFDRLQQLLQYSVIEKSKFLAYELITLSSRCPALYQIGLDMLKRRHDWEQIVEVLMTRGHLLEALRLLLNAQIDRVVLNKTLRRLLDLAWKSADRQLMFTVFSHVLYVQGRKQLAEVMSSDDFERYAQEFKLLYDREEVEEAVQRFRKARLSSIRRRSDTTARNDSFTFVPGDEEDDVLMKEGAEEDDINSIRSGRGISGVTGIEQQQETATDTDISTRIEKSGLSNSRSVPSSSLPAQRAQTSLHMSFCTVETTIIMLLLL